MQAVAVRLADLVAALGGDLVGDGNRSIDGIAPIDRAGPSHITFLAQARLAAQIERTGAGCVVVRAEHRDAAAARTAAIVTADPYLYFARLTQWWAAQSRPAVAAGIHPSAVVEPGAHIDASASVGALAFVGTGARIGAGAVLGAQAFVGAGAEVGAHTRLGARVVLESGCRIGQRGIVQPGAVIGGDGFGFAPHQGQWVKIEQLGGVRIGDDVEIGANTCIDRGALDDTVIEDGVKLDNLVQVGHNTRIGAHSAAAGCVGISGSATIGKRVTLAGAVGVAGHVTIADDVHVTAFTAVSRSLHQPGVYSGMFPIDDNATWEKNAATLRQLYALRNRLRALEKKTP